MIAATMFSGIGAPEEAMPEWDWRWHAEIEKFPCAVMAQRRRSTRFSRHAITPTSGGRSLLHRLLPPRFDAGCFGLALERPASPFSTRPLLPESDSAYDAGVLWEPGGISSVE